MLGLYRKNNEHDLFLPAHRETARHARAIGSHPRTRVAMIVMDYLGRGLGPEDIVRHYPYLTLAEVHAAMAYYHDHQQEIDTEIQAELQELSNTADANLNSSIWQELRAKGAI
jgi:uncharacterized protein (DUF433 family)